MFAYLSQNADNRIMEALKQDGFDIIPLAPFSVLSEPVSTHADMLLFAVDDKIFKHKSYQFEGVENVINIEEQMGSKYPNDVLLNIALVGRNAFCNTQHASSEVIEYLKSHEFTVHNVSQGYAHCSTCIISDNAVITADVSIANAATAEGIDTLKITEGYISLQPYSYGFIGGASGVCDTKIYFCGSLKYHPDGEKIRKFCEKHGKKVVELVDAPLSDIGGILFK